MHGKEKEERIRAEEREREKGGETKKGPARWWLPSLLEVAMDSVLCGLSIAPNEETHL